MKYKLLLLLLLIPIATAAEYTCQGNETIFIPHCIVQTENITIVPNATEYEGFRETCYKFLDELYNRTTGITELAEKYSNCLNAGEVCSKALQEARSEKVDYAKCQNDLSNKQVELQGCEKDVQRVESENQRNMAIAFGAGIVGAVLYTRQQEKAVATKRRERE